MKETLKKLDTLMGKVANEYDKLWYSLRKELTETMTKIVDNDPNKKVVFNEEYYGAFENVRGFKINIDFPDDIDIITKDGMKNSLDFFDLNEMRDFGLMILEGEYEIVEE